MSVLTCSLLSIASAQWAFSTAFARSSLAYLDYDGSATMALAIALAIDSLDSAVILPIKSFAGAMLTGLGWAAGAAGAAAACFCCSF